MNAWVCSLRPAHDHPTNTLAEGYANVHAVRSIGLIWATMAILAVAIRDPQYCPFSARIIGKGCKQARMRCYLHTNMVILDCFSPSLQQGYRKDTAIVDTAERQTHRVCKTASICMCMKRAVASQLIGIAISTVDTVDL